MPWKLTACWALGVLFKFLPLVAAKLDNGMAQPSSEAATRLGDENENENENGGRAGNAKAEVL